MTDHKYIKKLASFKQLNATLDYSYQTYRICLNLKSVFSRKVDTRS